MKDLIRRRAAELGFDLCRFTTAAPPESGPAFAAWLAAGRHGQMSYLQRNATQRRDPSRVLPGAETVIVVAVSYAPAPRFKPSTEGRAPGGVGLVACYAQAADYHEVLGARLKELAGFVKASGPPGTSAVWYVDTGPVLERDLAQRAGVGFVGKHTNLISRNLGNWFFLGEILTTIRLEPDRRERNRCGKCHRCLSACPTGALAAPFQLDARRCLSYLTIEHRGAIPLELRPAMGARLFGCDECLAVCPWNRFAQAATVMRRYLRPELARLDPVELLELDEAGFKARFRGTPIERAKWGGLRRNACVALGNVGEAAALPALRQAAQGPDALVAEHAAWALEQILIRSRAAGGHSG